MKLSRPVVALAATAPLALAAPAHATTAQVYMGTPPASQKAFQNAGADADAFFPKQTVVHIGDSVAFVPVGFHTVDLPKKGGSPLDAIAPTGQTISGEADAAGAAFWFNGQPQLGFATPLLASNYGKTVSYNGSAVQRSGLPLGDKLKPFTVKFTKKGTFTYFCNVHPGMKAQVKVLAKTARVPSRKAQKKSVDAQVAKALKTAKTLAKRKTSPGTIDVGRHGADGTELLAFLPNTAAVKVGDSLTFKMDAGSVEAHTVTTGPGNIDDATSYIGKLSSAFTSAPVFPGQTTYPSDPPPAGPVSLTPTTHGNGFWSAGVLDSVAASPLPAQGTVKFGAAGTYTFYCLIHPFMKETVTVS